MVSVLQYNIYWASIREDEVGEL